MFATAPRTVAAMVGRASGRDGGKRITQVPCRLGPGKARELRARASAGSEQRWMSSRSLSAMNATSSTWS